MSATSTVLGGLLAVRSMEPADLAGLLLIEKQRLGSRRISHDSPIRLPSNDGGIWVAVVQDVVVGYLVYQFLAESEAIATGVILGSAKGAKTKTSTAVQSLRVCLHYLYVAPEWRRQGIGRTLIERFAPELPRGDDCWLQAAVPESNLPMQLLLRSAGYRAVRILRGYCGDEDAYLMERPCG